MIILIVTRPSLVHVLSSLCTRLVVNFSAILACLFTFYDLTYFQVQGPADCASVGDIFCALWEHFICCFSASTSAETSGGPTGSGQPGQQTPPPSSGQTGADQDTPMEVDDSDIAPNSNDPEVVPEGSVLTPATVELDRIPSPVFKPSSTALVPYDSSPEGRVTLSPKLSDSNDRHTISNVRVSTPEGRPIAAPLSPALSPIDPSPSSPRGIVAPYHSDPVGVSPEVPPLSAVNCSSCGLATTHSGSCSRSSRPTIFYCAGCGNITLSSRYDVGPLVSTPLGSTTPSSCSWRLSTIDSPVPSLGVQLPSPFPGVSGLPSLNSDSGSCPEYPPFNNLTAYLRESSLVSCPFPSLTGERGSSQLLSVSDLSAAVARYYTLDDPNSFVRVLLQFSPPVNPTEPWLDRYLAGIDNALPARYSNHPHPQTPQILRVLASFPPQVTARIVGDDLVLVQSPSLARILRPVTPTPYFPAPEPSSPESSSCDSTLVQAPTSPVSPPSPSSTARASSPLYDRFMQEDRARIESVSESESDKLTPITDGNRK
jgi:hypothetical protein